MYVICKYLCVSTKISSFHYYCSFVDLGYTSHTIVERLREIESERFWVLFVEAFYFSLNFLRRVYI